MPLDTVGGKARRQRQASTPCIFMMGFILREPQSTPANFLENIGEGWAAMGDWAVHANSFPKLLFRLGSR